MASGKKDISRLKHFATKRVMMEVEPPSLANLKNLTSKGSYVLILELPKKSFITVGKLGIFMFLPGFYGYVGSAQGGLYRRLKRYLSSKRKKRWHIDYLLEEAYLKAIAICEVPDLPACARPPLASRPSKPGTGGQTVQANAWRASQWQAGRIECSVATKLHQTLSPIPGFGISDCLCSSHLYYHPIEQFLKTEVLQAFMPYTCSIIEI